MVTLYNRSWADSQWPVDHNFRYRSYDQLNLVYIKKPRLKGLNLSHFTHEHDPVQQDKTVSFPGCR